MDCIFCRIIQRQRPAEILDESGKAIAILDINPIHYGHALIIPKVHCRDFLTIPESDLDDVLHMTQTVARALVSTLDLKGFNVFSNNGTIAGQSICHFHMHVTPRYPDDNIRFVLQLKTYTDGLMAEYAERIRRAIRN